MKRFEYTVLDVPTKGFFGGKVDFEALTTKLNDLGKKGWEVATISDTNMHQGASRALIVILKRELTH